MTVTQRCLLARRIDGKFLCLNESHNTTSHEFVDDPELAKRIEPYKIEDLMNPHAAPYYFENSSRARNVWLKDCIMVPYAITTETKAILIRLCN